ncbi:MAG: ParB/RepB/Spo0J family partition protein [Rhodospirillales bacterium]|nr:ParB/RepB/Spo0J family partition protein [Rhodospirillales bacterium]
MPSRLRRGIAGMHHPRRQPMATTAPFSALLAPRGNPRRSFNKTTLEGLAQSIKKDGVLQNLVVKPEGKNAFRVVVGKRRYMALKLLNDRGDIADTYRVPIRLHGNASAADLDRIATVENVQREALDPIDEAEAFAKLLTKGAKIEDISAETGVSMPTIRRRLALADLAPEVKEAVRAKALPLSLAEALTLAPQAEHKKLLGEIKRYGHLDARQLRAHILGEKPSLASAIFPVERYTGTFTKDLFAEKETTYFDDREQFMALQTEAVDAKAEALRKECAWVEVATEHSVPWWQYRDTKGKEQGGAIIHLSPSGRVEVRKGLVKHEVDKGVAKQERKEKPKDRPAYARATLRYANAHKTLAMQMALMDDPRKAKETAAMLLLAKGTVDAGLSLRPHDALQELARHPRSSKAYAMLEEAAQKLLLLLGISHKASEEMPAWLRLFNLGADWTHVLPGLRSMSDVKLDCLVSLLPILCFGIRRLDEAEPSETLFAELAKDMPFNMREVWTPDEVFLAGLQKDALLKVATECGAARKHPGLGAATKKELVATLASYFDRTADPKATLDESGAKGRAWLPDCMRLVSHTAAANDA